MLRFTAANTPLVHAPARRRWGAALASSWRSFYYPITYPMAVLHASTPIKNIATPPPPQQQQQQQHTPTPTPTPTPTTHMHKVSAPTPTPTPTPTSATPAHDAEEEVPYRPSRSNRRVARWLYVSAAVVGGVVWFGGITRLTESGLSIVEWKPISGVRPPLTEEEWAAEFRNYQRFPEFLQKPDMTLDDFKLIFFWEWAHRVLARSLGLVYGVPLVMMYARGRFAGNRGFGLGLLGILGLGGAQGAMGWYMVRSGLDPRLVEERKKATVSAMRLTAHLFLAFLIYSFMLRMGFGLKMPRCQSFPLHARVQRWSRLSCTIMFATAMSGAMVAGLDAGLLYNHDFPWMAGGIVPPMDHLFALEPTWRNFCENHSMVQTCHRIMAGTTCLAITGLNVACSRRRGAVIPRRVLRSLHMVNAVLVMQMVLGMWTILSSVDVPVAASHQIGALMLLTSLIRMCAVLGSKGIILV